VHLEADAMSTKIPYLNEVWSPTTGCSPCSPGCAHCWAERMARRFNACRTCHGEGGFNYGEPPTGPDSNGTIEWQICTTCGGDPDWHFRPTWHENRLWQPLHWRKPRRVGVCFMGDLWHPAIRWGDQMDVLEVIEQCPQHDFLMLTKRAKRMCDSFRAIEDVQDWPLPNLWLGVSICTADELPKLNDLRDTPAALRWVSFEPLLTDLPNLSLTGIDWVVLGGETGAGARPMQPEWALDTWRQCREVGVPFYFKQLGTSREGNDPNLRISELSEFYAMLATREFPEGG
jgi:protein gp37